MPDRKPADPNKKTAGKPATNKHRLKPIGEVQLVHKDLPSKPMEDKRIHPRRPMPLIPERRADDAKGEESQGPPGSSKSDSKT